MNRQRRLEAIARRRAFLDNQLQMLASGNNHESRIPNIIRHRTGRSLTRPDSIPSPIFQSNSRPFSNIKIETTNDLESKASGKSESNNLVPVEITEKLASIIASNDGDLLKSLQTIETEDGTVMVVLDGDSIESVVEERPEVEDQETNETLQCNIPPASVVQPVDSQTCQTELVEAVEKSPEEESYVVLHSENGNDVLVPYSTFLEMQQRNASEELLINYVVSKSGAIEDQMSRNAASNKKVISVPVPVRQAKTAPQAHKRKAVSSTPTSHVVNIKRPKTVDSQNKLIQNQLRRKSVQGTTQTTSTCTTLKQPKLKQCDSRQFTAIDNRKEEKPRPFRFELPELEIEDQFNDPSEGFLTVPVPIKIDSLRSESRQDSFIDPKSSQKNVPAKMKPVGKDTLSCDKCSETFMRVLDLLYHVKECHTNNVQADTTPSFISKISKDGSTVIASLNLEKQREQVKTETLTSHCVHQPITCVIPNNAATHNQIFLIPQQDTGETVYFHILEDGEVEQSIRKTYVEQPTTPNGNSISNLTTVYEIYENEQNQNQKGFEVVNGMCGEGLTSSLNQNQGTSIPPAVVTHELNPKGRRTLNKATAKAGMSTVNEDCESGSGGIWIVEDAGQIINSIPESPDSCIQSNDIVHCEGENISVQSARIRARNDRVKAMHQKDNKEEELSINFKNIFQQVAKHEVAFI